MLLHDYYRGCMCATSFSEIEPGTSEYLFEAWEHMTFGGLALPSNAVIRHVVPPMNSYPEYAHSGEYPWVLFYDYSEANGYSGGSKNRE